MKHSKKKKNWTKKRKRQNKSKTKKKRKKDKKREREREKRVTLPTHRIFSAGFFTCSLSGSLSKYLEDKTLTLLKLFYPLSAIFCKSNCFL